MKKTIVLFVLSIIVFSCKKQPAPHEELPLQALSFGTSGSILMPGYFWQLYCMFSSIDSVTIEDKWYYDTSSRAPNINFPTAEGKRVAIDIRYDHHKTLKTSFYVPPKLEITNPVVNDITFNFYIKEGSTIEWKPDPENKNGSIWVEFYSIAPDPGTLSVQYHKDTIPDNGKYVITKDILQKIPKQTVLGIDVYRINDSLIKNNDLNLVLEAVYITSIISEYIGK